MSELDFHCCYLIKLFLGLYPFLYFFRSGFSLKDTVNFAESIELMMRQTLGVDADEQVDEEEEVLDEEPPEEDDEDEEEEEDEEDVVEEDAPKDEL